MSRRRALWGNKLRSTRPAASAACAWHALRRARRGCRLGQGHRRLLSQGLRDVGDASTRSGDMPAARVSVGPRRSWCSARPSRSSRPDDGHHIQVYVANFSRPHKPPARPEPDHRREQSVSVPLRRHPRPRERQAAVPDRARGALHDPSALCGGLWSTATRPRPTAITCRAAMPGSPSRWSPRWTIRARPCGNGGSRR